MNMVEVKTAELSGAALDWVVAKAVNQGVSMVGDWPHIVAFGGKLCGRYSPSTDWSQGGPLIDEYAIAFEGFTDATIRAFTMIDSGVGFGAGHLVAACRAIVDARLGDVVRVPAELVQEART